MITFPLRTLAVALLAGAAAGGVGAQEYHVDTSVENTVRFISSAAIEEFDGVTDRIDGYVYLEEPGLEQGSGAGRSEFYFEVDLASLETGISLRDRHMRDNYLEVEEYPWATLEGELGSIERRTGGGWHIAVVGEFTVHGVSRRVSVPCEATPDDRGFRVRCSWEILLSDYEIEIPQMMFMKLANEIRLELDFRIEPASEE